MLRIPTHLPDELEALASQVIGACVDVHRELGPGLIEVAYQRAVSIELVARGIAHETERVVPVLFKGSVLCSQRIDLVVDDRLIVELKAVERLSPLHLAQVISHLRATRLSIALLINFNVPVLKAGIRRLVP
jgi:GxxExxY protein